MNLVPRYDDPRPKTLKVIGWTRVFLKRRKQISKVGHGDLLLIRNTPLPQDELGTKI